MTYESLNAEFRLRVLRTEEDYEAAKAFWAKRIREAVTTVPLAGESVSEYAEVLSLLMADYEKRLLDNFEDEEEEEEEEDEEEDVKPTEPEEGDWVTSDYITFREHGGKGVIRVPVGGPWQVAVREQMFQDHFWPNVWHLSDHGNYEQLEVEMEEEE